jgi:ABC-type glutathione transport system ATPase component
MTDPAENPTPILSIRDLRKYFNAGRSGLWGKPGSPIHALDGVSLDLAAGEVLALVGESGCGKSTLSLTLMGLEKPTSGQFFFNGQDVTYLKGAALKELRRKIQMVFQDPYESLNPLMTVRSITGPRAGKIYPGAGRTCAPGDGRCRTETCPHLPGASAA